MAKQGRWILKNVRHDKPGVTIPSASLGLQSKTINLGSVTSNKKPDITTEVFTDLGVHLNLNNVTKNPAEGSTFVQGGLTYKVHWVLTEKPQPEPEPEPVITYRLRITDAPENCLPYNGVAQFDAILEKYIDGVHDESSDLLVTSESEWSFISGEDYATRNPAGSNKFIITGNNTTDSVQTVGIKAEYNGQSNVQPATTNVCFNPEEVPVERDIKISTNKIDADCEDNDLYVVTVTATNVDWTVTVTQNAQSWLSVQDITSDSFKVKVLDFDGTRRSGTITVYSTTEGTNISRTVTVTQEDCEPAPVVPKLEVSVSNIDALCKNNRTSAVTVTAENTEWTVTKCNTCSWITISNISSNGFSVSVSDSTENERTGIVTVASTTPGVNITREITISQPDCTPVPDSITINPDSWTIPCDVSDDTRYHFNITANVEWDFEGDVEATYDWIHIVETGETYFELKFEKNDAPDANERRAHISITGGTARATVSILQNKCEDVPPAQETINITTNDFEVPCETDETYTISVDASTGWTAATIAEWINITAITSDSIKITVSDNPGGDRDGIISAYTIEGGTMALDTITITQRECEIEDDIAVDVDSISFDCPGDSAVIHVSTTGDGVTWTATTNDNWIEIANPSSSEITVTVTGENRTRRNKQGTVTITSNISGKDPIEITIMQKPTMFFTVSTDTLQFDADGGTIVVDVYTNYAFSVSITASDSNWLSATRSQNTGNNTAWTVTFTALANSDTANPRTTVVTFVANYDGECEWGNMPFVTIEQDKAEPYIPPTPGAYFDVLELYGDFPYYAELGGYTHERSFMDENFYDCCADFTKGDIGGVVYLMPLRACSIQIYYDTNVDISNIIYEIEHISPANPSQEWLEVVLDPKGYGWSDKDSDRELYPGNFIMVKTFDNYEGTSLYDDTYTAYVHIKNGTTGKILKTIPVKCIPGDYRAERVSASKTETGSLKTRNLELDTIVPVTGGSVDVWVYANDSAYIVDHPDDDISWNSLTFYYEDGETRLPTRRNETSDGYIDKIYDTRCNDGERFHLIIKTGPNTSYSEITKGFELASENSGYQLIDLDSYCRVTFKQEKDRVLSQTNYRISEFYTLDSGMEPIFDGDAYDYSNITGATCDGNGHTIHPRFKAIYDYTRASNPSVTLTGETMNDGMITYDETKGQNVLNPNVLEVTDINYVNGGTNWIIQNNNYVPTQNNPFEFYIRPNSGHSQTGEARTAIITITYKGCSPQATKQFRIVQNYQYVEMQEVNMKMLSGGTTGTEYVGSATANTTSNGYIVINNDYNNYIYLSGEENVTIAIMPNTSTACTLESITDQQGGHMNDGVDIDIYRPISISGSWCQLFLKNKASSNSTYTINIMCSKNDRTTKTLTLLVNVA